MAPAQEMVTIGCRLPNGIVLEVGLQTTVRGGSQNGLISKVERKDDYERIRLKGTHWHQAAMFRMGIRPPSILNPEPFINHVPKAFWDRWEKEHPRSALVKGGSIFVIEKGSDPSNVKAAVVDAMSEPGPLAPMDPTKPIKIGDDTVTTANFKEG